MLGRSWTGGQDSSSSLHISYGLTHLFLVYFILSLANVSCIPALSPSTNTQIHDAVYTNALLATYVHTLVCSLLSRVFIPACRLNLRPQHPSSRRINSSEEETGTSFVLSSVSPNTELRRAFDTKVSELYKMFLDPPPSSNRYSTQSRTKSHPSTVLPLVDKLRVIASSYRPPPQAPDLTLGRTLVWQSRRLRQRQCRDWGGPFVSHEWIFFFFLRSPRTRTHHDPFAEQKHLFFFSIRQPTPLYSFIAVFISK